MQGKKLITNLFFKSSRLVFLRHGESEWNVKKIVQGSSPDPSITLSAAGRESVQPTLANDLKKICNRKNFQKIKIKK